MDDYALVLNAGSSSLKFCVYRRAGGRGLAPRGARPDRGHRHVAAPVASRTAQARRVADETLDAARPRRRAPRSTRWPPGCACRYGGARVLGVGHRVVHGGPRFAGPTHRHARGPRRAARADRRWRRCTSRTTSRRSRPSPSGCPTCRRSPASTPASIAASPPSPSWCRCRARSATRRAALRLPRPLLRVHRVGPAGGRAGDRRRARDRRASRQRREPVRAARTARASTARSGFTALDGLCMGTRPGALDPGVVLYLFQTLGLSREGGRDDALQEVRPARHLRHQQRHARSARQQRAARRGSPWTTSSTAPRKEIGALAAVLGGIDGLVFTAGIGENSAEIRRRICEASAWLGIELDRRRRTRGRPADLDGPAARVSAWVIPTNEELMIARHTGALLGLTGVRRVAAD